MAKDESDFQKLLSEAPMGSNADTVTLVGTLSRTADATHFVLALADGRSVTLEVAAVKSAKKIAGAIGQMLVQLELDAKRVPEAVSEFRPVQDYKIPAAESHPAVSEVNTSFADLGHTGVPDTVHTGYRDLGFEPAINAATAATTPWYADVAHAPFVAATPHQADPRTMAALSAFNSPFNGPRTYFTAYVWTGDHHTVLKPTYDLA